MPAARGGASDLGSGRVAADADPVASGSASGANGFGPRCTSSHDATSSPCPAATRDTAERNVEPPCCTTTNTPSACESTASTAPGSTLDSAWMGNGAATERISASTSARSPSGSDTPGDT